MWLICRTVGQFDIIGSWLEIPILNRQDKRLRLCRNVHNNKRKYHIKTSKKKQKVIYICIYHFFFVPLRPNCAVK